MKEALYKYLTNYSSANITIFKALEIMGVALVLAIVIFMTYKITFSGVMYNRKFNVSLVMLTLITTMIMIVIGNNVALSLGMVGALSIVRFRTAIKDPRDTAYIFWAIVVGLCVGTQSYMIAAAGSIVICIVMGAFSVGKIGDDNRYLLIIRGGIDREEDIMKCVFADFKNGQLRAKNSNKKTLEIIYQIKLKGNDDKDIIKKLYDIEGITTVNIVAQNGETIG
ncbi:MAG: DUF4956 domain-containing protein [Clostridium sp.]|uniref:DUF4956 domain-containing protein n=1 Tax=Clostridium sp. TaxID=1506 RepID=UPI003F308F7E